MMPQSGSRGISADRPPSQLEEPAPGTIYVELGIGDALARRGLQSIISSSDHLIEVSSHAETDGDVRSPVQEINHSPVVRVIGLRALSKSYSKRFCVLLAPDLDAESAKFAIQQGVRGIVAESDADRDILPAIQAIANNRGFLSTIFVRYVLDWLADRLPAHTAKVPEAYRQLSPREREVLMHLAEGAPNTEIARVMNISVATVRSHIYHMTTKLDLRSRAEAVIFGYEWRSLRHHSGGLPREDNWLFRDTVDYQRNLYCSFPATPSGPAARPSSRRAQIVLVPADERGTRG
jgi:DNA-binding NarL/FixJ family response regulator